MTQPRNLGAFADSTADKTAWATYRQALRDLPNATGFPWDMEWPIEPV